MKNIFESADIFEAYATIDAAYYEIGKISKKRSGRTAISIMIDKATGYDKANAQKISDIIDIIIENKKFIEADYSHDELAKNKLIEFINQEENDNKTESEAI